MLFKFLVSLFVVNKFVHVVMIVSLLHNTSHSSFGGGKYHNVVDVPKSIVSVLVVRLW